TSQAPSRLEVVAADDDPHVIEALREQDYRNAIGLLERHYNLVLLDTGTGVLESATRGVLDAADQLVIVTLPSLDGARAASLTLDWLAQNGYGELAAGAVAVLNAPPPQPGAGDLDPVAEHFPPPFPPLLPGPVPALSPAPRGPPPPPRARKPPSPASPRPHGTPTSHSPPSSPRRSPTPHRGGAEQCRRSSPASSSPPPTSAATPTPAASP